MKRIIVFALAVIGLVTLNGVAQAELSDGLVAYYPFNGNANDGSGNGNNGTVNGVTLTTDRFENDSSAYSFDGVANYIEIPNLGLFSGNENHSISLWFSADTFYDTQSRTLISTRGENALLLYTYTHTNKIEVWWHDGANSD